MKTALAIVCSLMLVWTNLVLASATSVAGSTRSCCPCGKKSSCCAAKQSMPESQPVSATPGFSFHNQFSPLAPATLAWTLPDVEAPACSSSLSLPVTRADAPLFARDCAWLI